MTARVMMPRAKKSTQRHDLQDKVFRAFSPCFYGISWNDMELEAFQWMTLEGERVDL